MRKIAEKQQKPSAIALTREAAHQRRKIILGELDAIMQTSDVKMAVAKRISKLREEEKKWEEEGSKARLTFLVTKV
jgi:hypothetical protein